MKAALFRITALPDAPVREPETSEQPIPTENVVTPACPPSHFSTQLPGRSACVGKLRPISTPPEWPPKLVIYPLASCRDGSHAEWSANAHCCAYFRAFRNGKVASSP